MSSVSPTKMPLSAWQQYKENSGAVQDKVDDSTETRQDMPSSAYEHNQQKRNEPKQENNSSRSDMPTSTLTSETMTRFEEQPDNNLQPLDDRVLEYRKASPVLGEQKSTEQHHNPMVDSMKDWSDKWEGLARN